MKTKNSLAPAENRRVTFPAQCPIQRRNIDLRFHRECNQESRHANASCVRQPTSFDSHSRACASPPLRCNRPDISLRVFALFYFRNYLPNSNELIGSMQFKSPEIQGQTRVFPVPPALSTRAFPPIVQTHSRIPGECRLAKQNHSAPEASSRCKEWHQAS